ncbi:M28 family metallopeptidase [Ferruginibacter yonginensis]|uniref:M28 family metallopeptidase n=1 Tax=Ferruginibacter yonginensis TaxID=1310416 RepID=A0ABV8QR45_9BACT
MKVVALFVNFMFTAFAVKAQDISYNKNIVNELTSSTYWGRGYTNNGMKKAADYLAAAFEKNGLQPLQKNKYLQPFTYNANSFPGKMEVTINGKKLTPGVDFIVSPDCKGVDAKGTLEQVDSVTFVDKKNSIIVVQNDKLTWSAAQKVVPYTVIEINKKTFTETPTSIKANIENELIKNFEANNVAAFVKGTAQPDSFIFITAHYDHLGGMGSNTYFPGANDNASGVALLLSLSKYYAAHPQKYSIGFILFAGEEIGLLGSKYFTEHPLTPLKNIRFLINTDLAGTGDEGITVVNATEFPKEFAIMNNINNNNKYLSAIGARGKAANSDHYWFTEKGVPAFFFYTRGGIAAYHDVFDKAETLPLNEQADLQSLLIAFITDLQ